MKGFNMLKNLLGYLDNNIEEILIIFLCSTLVICLLFTVMVRYAIPALSMASHWAEELALFSFIWLLYFGASLATRTGNHFRVTAQFGLLPKKSRKYAMLPGNLIWLIFNCVLIKYGFMLLKMSMEESLSLQIPMKYVYFIIPLSFIFISFRLIQNTFRVLKSGRDPFEKTGER
jgi:TRAP-type C4-dicarboxylate transport system permease small subunit